MFSLLRLGSLPNANATTINYAFAAWLCYRTECEGDSRLQKLNEAVTNLHESLKYDPNSGKTYYYLGRCYSAIPGRAHDAFVNYRQSIDKSEADADTWCSIGLVFFNFLVVFCISMIAFRTQQSLRSDTLFTDDHDTVKTCIT